ncbi:MAG: PTS sugar transporter subunit IIA [Planctomycetes bacterium]|nr:PTS sugar transporter subunit IIA [Planctomycetota bacterium]
MRFQDLLAPENVVLDLAAAERGSIFEELADRLISSGRIPGSERSAVLAALAARETLGTTGVGRGVAIPHAKVPGVKGLHLAVGIHRGGIDFRAIDGEPVHAVVLIVRAEKQDDLHLRVLKKISQAGRHRDCRSFLLQAKSALEVIDLLEELGHG